MQEQEENEEKKRKPSSFFDVLFLISQKMMVREADQPSWMVVNCGDVIRNRDVEDEYSLYCYCSARKTDSLGLIQSPLRLNILSKNEVNYYKMITTGEGSVKRFKIDHDDFDPQKFNIRRKINNLIILGFCSTRPKCQCNQFAKPRKNSRNGSYFYSCYYWPNGCRFTANAKHDAINTTEMEPRERSKKRSRKRSYIPSSDSDDDNNNISNIIDSQMPNTRKKQKIDHQIPIYIDDSSDDNDNHQPPTFEAFFARTNRMVSAENSTNIDIGDSTKCEDKTMYDLMSELFT